MSCSRIRRELLWLSRYGELDSDSQPHLDHLVGCRGCRDAIGVDRMMVEQLRIALAERVANASPSPGVWEQILVRAQAPDRGPLLRFLGWSAGFIGLQRAATAIAGSGLALLLAVNTELVPMTVPVDPGPSVRTPDALEVSSAGLAPSLFFAEEPARAEWVSAEPPPKGTASEYPKLPGIFYTPQLGSELDFEVKTYTPDPYDRLVSICVPEVGDRPRWSPTSGSFRGRQPARQGPARRFWCVFALSADNPGRKSDTSPIGPRLVAVPGWASRAHAGRAVEKNGAAHSPFSARASDPLRARRGR